MTDVFVSLIANIIIALMSVVIYVLLISGVYPRLFVKWQTKKKIRDRGLEKYIFPEGRSVVYEPELKARKYIKQYALLCQDGNKYIKCFVNTKLRYIKYDVLVYNNMNELVDVIAVSEKLSSQEYSRAVPLPGATSYVSVVLRCADNMYVNEEEATTYSLRHMGMFAGAVTVTTVIESLVVQACAEKIWDCFYRPQTFVQPGPILVKTIIAGIVCSALIVLTYYMRAKRVINK